MKKIYQEQLKIASTLQNDDSILKYLSSVLRSILQTAAVSLLELAQKKMSTEELDIDYLIERFQRPSDGMPIQIIETLLPHVRNQINDRILYGWYEENNNIKHPLSKELQSWVEFRNSKTAHGVCDEETTKVWAERTNAIIKLCLQVFTEIIPDVSEKKLKILGESIIDTPLILDEHAIVISQVVQKKGIWKLKAQLLSNSKSYERTVTLNENTVFNGLKTLKKGRYKVDVMELDHAEYIVEHNVPIRQTDIFEGRGKELSSLEEWFNNDDSRRCLIYGDGGYGKTTLVLEALNRYIEGSMKVVKMPPELICYYTAKMTRWNADGLTHLASIQPVIEESIRELMKCFFPVLEKQWYVINGNALIDKAVTVLKDNKYTRDNVLIIIDNTETLSLKQQDTIELAEIIERIGKSIGRVIVTSRRYETIEAKHLLVEGLTENDCILLLRRLAEEYDARPILLAGDARLKQVSNKLTRKPILLEALVAYIARGNISIDSALEKLYKKSDEDLLEFLYEDAWTRLNALSKDVFYIAVSLSCPVNDISIGKACQLLQIQHIEFQNSLKETYFASTIDYGSGYEIELIDLAKRFFEKKLQESAPEKKSKIATLADTVEAYVREKEKIEMEYREDRVAEAFRNEFAKAAKVATNKGDLIKAKGFYELAIADDPMNAALHDRFAWFLLNLIKDPTSALIFSEKSIQLNPNGCDATVTLALIQYRTGNLKDGDANIDAAQKLGRPLAFCLLQKAIARYHAAYDYVSKNLDLKLLQEAKDMLTLAKRNHAGSNGYDAKNLSEIVKYEELILRRLNLFSARIKN